jgi:hypothetical protein
MVNDKLSNAGEIQFKILDKGFVTEKEFKKLSKTYKNVKPTLQTTKMIFTLN